MKDDFVIGVLGGMGTYATIHLFKQYAEVFPAVKEWDRPRIIIDNRCTMPSRVLAFLHHEKEDELISEMSDSMQHLIDSGATHIVLACNTSHLFLPAIYKNVPELEPRVQNIILNCVERIKIDCLKEVFLLGSEGTIESGVYQSALSQEGIKCLYPTPDEYANLRICIEAVKQNNYSDAVKQKFIGLIGDHRSCILGCTELPIIFERYKTDIPCINSYDPLLITLEKIKTDYNKNKGILK